MYHRPVCTKCQLEMRPEKNGVGVLDMADSGPYQLWDADLYKCPNCEFEIVVGFGQEPVDHYEESFDARVEAYKTKSRLIPCWSKKQ